MSMCLFLYFTRLVILWGKVRHTAACFFGRGSSKLISLCIPAAHFNFGYECSPAQSYLWSVRGSGSRSCVLLRINIELLLSKRANTPGSLFILNISVTGVYLQRQQGGTTIETTFFSWFIFKKTKKFSITIQVATLSMLPSTLGLSENRSNVCRKCKNVQFRWESRSRFVVFLLMD